MFVLANWKMHGDMAFLRGYVRVLLQQYVPRSKASMAMAVPFVYLPALSALLQDSPTGSSIALAAQNMAAYASGAYTGEVSAAMLADCNCSYVIIGHSERRAYFAENDAAIVAKVKQALAQDIIPILCVGETEQEVQAGKGQAVVQQQLDAVLAEVDHTQAACMIFAYEPVWAIGSGQTATPQQAQNMHGFMRSHIAAYFGQNQKDVDSMRILYGGSVRPDNAADLIQQPDVDGFLVGSASLDPDKILKIYNIKSSF